MEPQFLFQPERKIVTHVPLKLYEKQIRFTKAKLVSTQICFMTDFDIEL